MSSTMFDPLSEWEPASLEDTYVAVDLCLGMNDGEKGSNYFYVKVATPEALRKRSKNFLISDNRVIVIDYYILRKVIENILKKCTRENWEESCLVSQRYFSWEYEDYHYEK
ncbi:hypothetical protein DNW06_04680 [Salmonella enterica subsp. enterica]|nr:hypothetical protein [Salmonella enterica subsp. enterica serovar Stanley]ECU0259680.1 hypothetical protein [Salmonella enterica]EBY1821055.1 hypothetical protein [Salmonella enterica subsp. enterica serovar Stanley]ECD1155121.1 hypothetical protein [Salmonella enterica subsp. enterica serovar Stanley]EDA3356273.1 hypothetical protein [Salmonella enterica subsp. enterica serovar Stanley]